MKKGIKYILLTILLSTQISCSDWMNLLPPEGLIREEFWHTKEDVEAVLMSGYVTLRGLDATLFKMGEIRAEMLVGDILLGNDERKIMEGNIYSDNGLCNWGDFYKIINYCNEVIINAPVVQKEDDTFTEYQLQGYLAEAYFLRSLTYFYLVRIFKDVPYITEPAESDDAEFYYPKTDGDEILINITNDLKTVRPYITVDGYTTLVENKGRATKAAIDALLADIALWRFDYEAVIEHVDNIIKSNKYKLLLGPEWFELYYPGNSIESIFELQFEDQLNQGNGIAGLTGRYNYVFDPSEIAIQKFSKEAGSKEFVRGEDVTIRKFGDDDFIIWKYVGLEPDGYTTRPASVATSCNFIIYRYADVLLMKAEALSQLERFSEAQDIINAIRDRADVVPLSLADSKTAYEDAILDERALELAYEGKRWFDLLRMGRRNNYSRKAKLIDILVSNVPSTQKRILATKLTNPLGWYFPIHDDEIERNKNLEQNPYYNF